MTTITAPTATAGARYIEHAQELVPLLRAEARAIEDARELTPPVLAALTECNLFQLLLDPARGEGEVSLTDCVRILEILASGDGSTAWDVMNCMGAAVLSAFLPPESVDVVFAGPSDAVATAIGRFGKATAVEGGYLVEARWPFLSGSPHATWIGGLCFVFDGDQQRTGPEGQPHVIMPLLRKERVTVLDTWHATGLRGTGSHDADVAGAFVPAAQVIDFARGPRAGLPLIYSIDDNAIGPVAAASVAIGIAAGAIDAFRETVAGRTHQSGIAASMAPLPQLALAQGQAAVDGARAALTAAAALVDAELAAGRLPGPEHVRRASLTGTSVMETAIDVVSSLYRAAGSSAVFTGSALERALRDVFTLGAHRMVQRENYLVHGPSLFD
ncbi:MAG TPA: hypothetical protein VFY90_05815 [Tepidiformaceae bacterium]|nr:hypothetical protein [Tepidiformaceae bacterium]